MAMTPRTCLLLPLAILIATSLPATSNTALVARKKVLYVASYHSTYPWSAGVQRGLLDTLGVREMPTGLDDSASPVAFRLFEMDTKRKSGEADKIGAAARAKAMVDEYAPDILLTSDDDAVKYLVAPNYREKGPLIVFCGVNWDASSYKLPRHRATGMVEIQLVGQIVETLRPHAKGKRIAFLKGDDDSARKEAAAFEKSLGRKLTKRFVPDFATWKTEYRRLQKEADILLLGNAASVDGWNSAEATTLIHSETKIPSGNWDAWMAPFALVTFATVPEEQGEFLADTTLALANGRSPATMPVATNRKAKVQVNPSIAKKLGIRFPVEFLDRATFVEETTP